MVEQLDPKAFDIIANPSNAVQLLALNNAEKPLDDPRVRQALNYGADIQGIIDAAFYGRGEPSGSPLIPGLARYYETSLRDPYPLNIEKAKSLLEEAGYGDGFSLEITVSSNYTMHVDTAQVLVHQFARIGVTATIKLVDWATWLSEIYHGRHYQATIISLDGRVLSPRSFLERYCSDSRSNFVNFSSPAYDVVFEAAVGEMDEDLRVQRYKEAQRILSDEAVSVYIQATWGFRVFPKGRFAGLLHYPLFVLDFSTVYPLNP
jgi:peptide/nickel transport system substrate-binding protein